MSSNLIGGFFNRLEASRKYLFGSVGVLGTTNNSVISGVLIARGQDIKPVVDVAPDWESYSYKKLDLDNAEDKAYFEAALAWDLEVDGKKWVDGKNVSHTPIHTSVQLYSSCVYSSSNFLFYCCLIFLCFFERSVSIHCVVRWLYVLLSRCITSLL